MIEWSRFDSFVITKIDLPGLFLRPQKFENATFTLKTYQMFSAHNMAKKIEKATIIGRLVLDLCFRKTWAGKSSDYRDVIVRKELRF